MNYQKIYLDFIESRRTRLPAGVVETHHILPRLLGGTDAESNLIKLSIEDHFFAHLLLARIHGGQLIASVFLVGQRKRRNKPHAGVSVAYRMMQRLWAKYTATMPKPTGRDNGMYNQAVFDWVNLDTGETRSATLYDMHVRFGGSRPSWTAVLTNDKNSTVGWTIYDGREKCRGLKGKQFLFVNIDGREFVGTQQQFCRYTGASIATASRICRHGVMSSDGWSLPTTVKPAPSRLNTGGLYQLQKDGVSRMMKRKDAAEFLGCTTRQFSSGAAYALKHNTPYKGWAIAKVN